MKIQRGKKKDKQKSTSPSKKKSTDIKIFAIDPASKLGWAVSRDIYGTWDLSTRKDESMGMKLLRLRAKLEEVKELQNPDLIVYERAAGAHKASIAHESKLIGEIESFCEANNIEYRAFSATEIKKFATGKGNAGKPLMIEAAKQKLGYPEEKDNDNEADALWILELAKHELNL